MSMKVKPESEHVLSIDTVVAIDIFEPEEQKMATRTPYPTYEERLAAKNDAEKEGFSKGAVVVRETETMYNRTDPLNWGIVIDLVTYTFQPNDFGPIKVKWVRNGAETFMYTNELFMVNYAPDDSDLASLRQAKVEDYYVC